MKDENIIIQQELLGNDKNNKKGLQPKIGHHLEITRITQGLILFLALNY